MEVMNPTRPRAVGEMRYHLVVSCLSVARSRISSMCYFPQHQQHSHE